MVSCAVLDVSFDPTAFLGPFGKLIGYDFSPGFKVLGGEVASFEEHELLAGPPGFGGPFYSSAGVFVEEGWEEEVILWRCVGVIHS